MTTDHYPVTIRLSMPDSEQEMQADAFVVLALQELEDGVGVQSGVFFAPGHLTPLRMAVQEIDGTLRRAETEHLIEALTAHAEPRPVDRHLQPMHLN